jgi:WbqC-like protein family
MSKRVAILQSAYIPWKGYFDIIHDVDEFIFLDDVQYTRQDWRNRNRIKTPAGLAWLTIPVGTDLKRRICDVELPPTAWRSDHLRRLENSYRDAPFFEEYRSLLDSIYPRDCRTLSELNQHAIRTIAALLGITTTFRDSRELHVEGRQLDRVIAILQSVRAGVYVSGPAAKSYIEPQRFADAGIELVWKSYDGYPEYTQLHPPFAHEVTVLDLLFHTGPDAPRYIWGWRT